MGKDIYGTSKMTTNASPQFSKAQGRYLDAGTIEEKLTALDEMLREAPKHKSSENLLSNLKQRKKRLLGQLVKQKKSRKGSREGIKKEDMQAVVVGLTNSGKSYLLSNLTNAQLKISNNQFTTIKPIIGMMSHNEVSVQLIEIPAFGSEYYDKGLVNTADAIIILAENLKQIQKIEKGLEKAQGKRLIALNKIDLLSENEKRKISATLASKKYNFALISNITQEGYDELKNKIFQSFDKIRVFTKEPGKEASKRPIIMNPNSTLKDIAEKILKGFSKKVKETRIWGPSSKFAGQKIGLSHKLKDMDVVEFKTN